MKNGLLLLLCFLFVNSLNSQNLLTNGDFENGANVGYITNGAGYNQLTAPFSGTTVPGNYAVTNFPKTINTANFLFVGDKTSGNGKMLIIDGKSTTAGNTRFWSAGNAGSGVTGLTIGTTYVFSYWIRSVSSLVTNAATQADISVLVTGGNLQTLVTGASLAPLPAVGWKQVAYTFVATATTVQIEMWNTKGSTVGNDFAIDEMMLTSDLMVTANVTNATCATANNGSMTVLGLLGVPPYINYSISGPVNQNNATGIFPNLPPGVYTVTVTDSALPTASTATLTNVVVGPQLTVSLDETICATVPITLNVGGSSSTYTWTANPADATLTTPNASSITVSPTVTTVYTVTSTVGSCAQMSKSVTVTVLPSTIPTFDPVAPICIGDTFAALPTTSTNGIIGTWSPAIDNTITTTYTFTPTVPAQCLLNAQITLTVNQATVNPPIDQTICPGNVATVNLVGTAFSTVTLTNQDGATFVGNIGPAGTGTFVTPILQSTQVYTVVKVKNFFTQCERFYTGMSFTITVVPNGCATVGTVPAPGTQPLDLTLCSPGECRTIEANISDVPSTTSYAASQIPYCPYPFTGPGYNIVPITSGDDFWSPLINLPFSFCFYGQNYTSCNAGTNGLLTFRSVTAGGFCDWPDTSVSIANIINQQQSIFGVFQDTDMSVPPSAPDFQVNWVLEGTYPCRKLIVNFYHLGQWNSTGSNPGLQTSQIVLYEVSNIIEVFVERRVAGTPWAGSGVIGIIGSSGAQSLAAPNRDTGAWSANMEAWRFTPTGPNVPVLIKWFEGPTQIGTGPSITVCPTATTTYTLNAEYTICNAIQTATSNVTLTVNPDLTSAPINIPQCVPNNLFDLTQNNINILGSLDPNDYDISYHLTQAEANVLGNPIMNPTAYPIVGASQTIYAAIFLNAFGCIVVKPFVISLTNCTPTLTIPPDLTLCENTIGSGVATFDFTPQIPIILGGNSPTDYTVSFHTSLLGATNNTGIISPINSVNGTDGQQIFIRYLDNATNGVDTGFFTLHVNPKPTATISGAVSICSGQTATINFTGTPNAVINFSGGSVTLNAAGTATFTTPALSATTSYSLIDVTIPATGCSSIFTDSITITVYDLPTATISGTTTVCVNDAQPSITFTGANSTSPYTFTYLDPAGATQTITTTTGSSIGLSVSTAIAGTFNYQLVSVSNSTTPVCSQNQSGTATVTVNPLPSVSISGTVSICSGNTATITFTGTPDAVVDYTVGSTPAQIILDATGNATLVTSALTATNVPTTVTYTLVNVTNPTTNCSKLIGGSAVITVIPLPTATITGDAIVCQGSPSRTIT
ncbi:MAG: hypothetical protein LCH35_07800, partial [Bacteroidetes bacterium]|nr:hypothetical protein [Bacteroidota bacterium]